MYIRGEQYTGKNNLRREDDKCFITFSKIVQVSAFRASRMHAPPGTLVLPIILFVFIFTEMKVRIEVAKTALLVGDMSRKLQFL